MSQPKLDYQIIMWTELTAPVPRTGFYPCFLSPPTCVVCFSLSLKRRRFLVQETKQSHCVRLSFSLCCIKNKNKYKKTQGGKWGSDVEIQRREQTLLGSDPSTSSLIAVTALGEALSVGRRHVFNPSRAGAARLNKTSCHYTARNTRLHRMSVGGFVRKETDPLFLLQLLHGKHAYICLATSDYCAIVFFFIKATMSRSRPQWITITVSLSL